MCKRGGNVDGVGNRWDHQTELLFVLRRADHMELIAQAGTFVTKPRRA